MDFKDILAISGRPGLYKFIAQGRNSVIVENLETGKRISAFTTERVSSFEEISVFTRDGDVPLADVLDKIYRKLEGKKALSPKSSPDEIKKFFTGVLPEYDAERVYLSDIRKIVLWYNTLQNLDLIKELLDARKKEVEEEKEASSGEKENDSKDLSTETEKKDIPS